MDYEECNFQKPLSNENENLDSSSIKCLGCEKVFEDENSLRYTKGFCLSCVEERRRKNSNKKEQSGQHTITSVQQQHLNNKFMYFVKCKCCKNIYKAKAYYVLVNNYKYHFKLNHNYNKKLDEATKKRINIYINSNAIFPKKVIQYSYKCQQEKCNIFYTSIESTVHLVKRVKQHYKKYHHNILIIPKQLKNNIEKKVIKNSRKKLYRSDNISICMRPRKRLRTFTNNRQ